MAPLFLPISARASGEEIEMRPSLASASGSPTICQTFFLSVSSSISVTVAPNLTVSPDSLDTSITSARASLSSSSAMRPSLMRLRLLGGVIFGVLREVAMRARVGDLLDDARPLHLLAVLQLGFQRGVAGGGHRDLFHRSSGSASDLRQNKTPIAGRSASGHATADLCPKLSPSCRAARPAFRPCRRNSSAARGPRDRPRGRL